MTYVALLTASLLFAQQPAQQPPVPPEPLVSAAQIGHFHYKASTKNRKAQAFFDQGLAMVYGYDYRRARRSFQQAADLDPNCAIAYWGVALAHGPTINWKSTEDDAKAALDALDKADKAPNATPLERQLISIERKRYVVPFPADQTALNKAYADAMRDLWHEHPNDENVGALFADALIDEHPWDQWTPDGQAKEGTVELMQTLDDILKLDPMHPHALHLYIHAYEASPFPEKALFAADRLENLQPTLGHMQHMPCHIYVHTGNWEKAVKANQNSLATTTPYLLKRGVGDMVGPLSDHVEMALAYAASMSGQFAVSQKAAEAITPAAAFKEMPKMYPGFDGQFDLPLENLRRFGKWDQILAAPEYNSAVPISNAMRHADRAIAFAATGKLDDAKKEREELDKEVAALPDTTYEEFDKLHDFMSVEQHLVAGEILVREDGQENAGIEELRKAVAAQDALHYSEPPLYLMPTRQSLGAALVLLNRYPEAEAAYREDLRRNPENGWSLFGLAQALTGEHKNAEAADVQRRFKKAWRNADVAIQSSCACFAKGN